MQSLAPGAAHRGKEAIKGECRHHLQAMQTLLEVEEGSGQDRGQHPGSDMLNGSFTRLDCDAASGAQGGTPYD